MVNFSGWQLPAQYGSMTPMLSTTHTRNHASLFDVSHMLQWNLVGRDASECLEHLCVADVHGIADNRGTLSVLTNEQGGIIDDFIINRIDQDRLYIVSNAGNADKDIAHVKVSVDCVNFIDREYFVPAIEIIFYIAYSSSIILSFFFCRVLASSYCNDILCSR